MSRNFSVLCAISHGLYEPWISILHEGQEKTWLTEPRPPEFDVIHFHGTPLNKLGIKLDKWHEKVRWSTRSKARILKYLDYVLTLPLLAFKPKYSESKLLKTVDRSLHIHFLDSYLTYRWKELTLFRYFLEKTEFDYLFITSSSSYIRIEKLLEFISKLDKQGIYAGAQPYESAQFISGSNRILSRDVVERVVNSSHLFNPTVIEDVALGNLITRLGFSRVAFPISNIASLEELSSMSKESLDGSYHFRLKSGPLEKRGDVEIMQQLHKRIKEMEGS